MPANNSSYETIQRKISSLKATYPSLRIKPDNYVFSALCVKANFYKNPALNLDERDIEEMIVDSQYDGGVDILLTDPNSENSDLVIAQSKFYSIISNEDIINAMTKMAMFYKDMLQGHYEQVNSKVQGRFLSLNSELGEDAKIHFVFYTSALQSGINTKRIEKKFRDQFSDSSKFEVSIYFAKDIEEEIKESESRRPSVEFGKIRIDKTDNYLMYDDNAAIVNVSAFSIKCLYAQHNISLLAKNLRYHIKGKIDKDIAETIQKDPESFWRKNNGITIICDDFCIDGKEVKLRNFSIVNGGQTTYILHKSQYITESMDLFLPCKIVQVIGENEDEKNNFSLEIAKATNSQKPIKSIDLKANASEQIRFAQNMREVGIFYQTKRGEEVPRSYKEAYLNSSLDEIGKLCLAALFQRPGKSRTKPSLIYAPLYYDKVFNSDQLQVAKLCRELLYINHYFKNNFLKVFDRESSSMPDANDRISFAHNARTICVAFTALASRCYQGNINNQDLQVIFDIARSESISDSNRLILDNIFANLNGIRYFLPPNTFKQKDIYDAILYRLFTTIINEGIALYSMESRYDPTLTATNFLKKDEKYYDILRTRWFAINNDIQKIFSEVM